VKSFSLRPRVFYLRFGTDDHTKKQAQKCSSTIFTHVPLLLSRARRSQAEPRAARTVSRRRSTAQQVVLRKMCSVCAGCGPAALTPAVRRDFFYLEPPPAFTSKVRHTHSYCPSRLTVVINCMQTQKCAAEDPLLSTRRFRMVLECVHV
jgi:hypothetical protein